MSIAAITDRIAELQALTAALDTGLAQSAAAVGGAAAPAASATSGSANFPALLQQASAAQATPSTAGDPTAYDGLIQRAAQANAVDPALLKALIRQESGFNPNARSGAGAVGLTQLMPSTAAGLGVTDATDPQQSIDAGARYLRQQLDAFGGDEAKALAAYNAGPGAVQKYGGIPPYAETQSYVTKVLGYANAYRSSTPVTIT